MGVDVNAEFRYGYKVDFEDIPDGRNRFNDEFADCADEDGYYMYLSYDCDECGHENKEYGRFCAGCGAKVVES